MKNQLHLFGKSIDNEALTLKHSKTPRVSASYRRASMNRHTDTVGYQHLIINVLENLITGTSIQNEQSIISSANIHYYGAGHNLYGSFM